MSLTARQRGLLAEQGFASGPQTHRQFPECFSSFSASEWSFLITQGVATFWDTSVGCCFCFFFRGSDIIAWSEKFADRRRN